MSQSNSTSAFSPASGNARKRPASGRVVPAIPLALSKPRPTRDHTTEAAKKSLPKVEKAQEISVGSPVAQVEEAEIATQDGWPESANLAMAAVELTTAPREDEIAKQDISPQEDKTLSEDLQNGISPQQARKTQPQTPPPLSSPAAIPSPSSTRKPLERLNTHSMRTGLPPAFVPSAEQQTPLSAASSAASHRFAPFYPHTHPSYSSTGSIIFGGPESSSSSPAPPQSAGNPFTPPQFPHFQSTHVPFFGLPSHQHHPSETHPHATFSASYPHAIAHNGRGAFYPHAQPLYYPPNGPGHGHGHAPFRYPPRETFMPAVDNTHMNGVTPASRPSSTASSARPDSSRQHQSHSSIQFSASHEQRPGSEATFYEPKVAFPGPPPLRQSQISHPMVAPYLPYAAVNPELSADMDNSQALRDHIFSHFLSGDFADCSLTLRDSSGSTALKLHGHGIALSRSPKLSNRMQKAGTDSASRLKQLHVQLEGPFENEDAFVSALRYLYGGPLLEGSVFLEGLPLPRTQAPASDDLPDMVDQHMRHLLAYVTAGSWLEVLPIADRGLEIATSLLRYESTETALAFALEGGLSSSWQSDESNEDRVSTSSSDDSFSKLQALTTPTYDPYATRFLHGIIDFMVNTFPRDFFLDTSAPQLSRVMRLPPSAPTHESRPSRSDSRISRIRFGELPIEEPQGPPYITTVISSITLSLPFLILKYLLEHYILSSRLGAETVASIMRAVVAEREVRRVMALKARPLSGVDDLGDVPLVSNIYWEESVEASRQNRVGYRLVRRRRGVDTPPSSGAASEQNK